MVVLQRRLTEVLTFRRSMTHRSHKLKYLSFSGSPDHCCNRYLTGAGKSPGRQEEGKRKSASEERIRVTGGTRDGAVAAAAAAAAAAAVVAAAAVRDQVKGCAVHIGSHPKAHAARRKPTARNPHRITGESTP